LEYLNELEWDPTDNTILANVCFQNVTVRIHPRTGQGLHVYVFSKLYTYRAHKADVTNEIALHPADEKTWWITGKYWPNLHLVKLLD
jgi:glutamine cyclotransferase